MAQFDLGEFIDRQRQKTHAERQRLAFLGASVFTGFIFLLWVSSFAVTGVPGVLSESSVTSAAGSQTAAVDLAPIEHVEGAIDDLWQSVSGVLEQLTTVRYQNSESQ